MHREPQTQSVQVPSEESFWGVKRSPSASLEGTRRPSRKEKARTSGEPQFGQVSQLPQHPQQLSVCQVPRTAAGRFAEGSSSRTANLVANTSRNRRLPTYPLQESEQTPWPSDFRVVWNFAFCANTALSKTLLAVHLLQRQAGSSGR